MSNAYSSNQSNQGAADLAQIFHTSADAAKREQRKFWLLSGIWLIAIIAVALQFGSQVSKLQEEQETLRREVAAARTAGEAAKAAAQGVVEVRKLLFALQGSSERRAELDNRTLTAKDRERFAIMLAEAEVDRQPLTASERELLAAQREALREGDSPVALYFQGSALVTSDSKGAIAKLKLAVTKDPVYEPAWAALGKAYRYNFEYKDADEALSKAIELNKTRAYTRAERCNVRINLEIPPSDVTMDDCTRAIELNSDDWVPYHYRAFGNYHRRNDMQAEEDWRKAAELRDTPSGSLENLGLIYLRRQEWQQALDNAQAVALIDPTSSWNWLFLSIAADRLGRGDLSSEARGHWLKLGNSRDVSLLTPLLPPDLKANLTL